MANREPKVHVIDGVTYVEFDRKAEVGDKILMKCNSEFAWGIREGRVISAEEFDDEGFVRVDGGSCWINPINFVVLEPLETVDTSQASPEVEVDERDASPSVVDMLANLARRVTSLEQQLAATQRNLETWAEDTENAKRMASKALRVTGDHGGWLIRNAKRLDKSEELIEMLTDDVITLDERSQILSAINKYYAEGRR